VSRTWRSQCIAESAEPARVRGSRVWPFAFACVALMLPALVLATALTESGVRPDSAAPARITILVDAFGAEPGLHRDWGYSALVEFAGRRILFDAGNDAEGFARNVRQLRVDLSRLDAVVISHRHGDHTAGLRQVLELNPGVPVYVPDDEAFSIRTPAAFFRHAEPSLPASMRYFGGEVPDVVPHGTAWPEANFVRVTDAAEIAPGFRVIRSLAPDGAFVETP
jgi:7,8-dihydropterin-6-yl-methyl-4-(beta-D-ribofuranosyl)aminobenzene 5'-phosphate synthase